MPRRLRLLVADDHAELLRNVCDLLMPDFEMTGTVDNGSALIAAASLLKPDVIVTDLTMPEIDGIEATRRILKAGACRAVVVLSVDDNPEVVRSAFEAGAYGYVLKVSAGEDLAPAVRAAFDGQRFLSPALGDLEQTLPRFRQHW